MDATLVKRFAVIQHGLVHWIFDGDARPEFAPYVRVVNVTAFPDAKEGDFWNEDAQRPVDHTNEEVVAGMWSEMQAWKTSTHEDLAALRIVVKHMSDADVGSVLKNVKEDDWRQAKLTKGENHYVDHDVRNSDMIIIDDCWRGQSRIHSMFWSLIADYEEQFGVQYHSLERPQLVRYKHGGFFKPHLDGLGRRLTLIAYLNGDFEGGELVFQQSKTKLKCDAGLLVAFPSTYVHTALPIISGTKYAVVSWAR